MPVVGTKAAASAQGFGEFAQASSAPVYIESVFSTYLYTGNGSTQTITNGIDLSTYGGLTWIKRRDAAGNNFLFDTQRGALNTLFTDDTSSQVSFANSLTSFNSGGFSLGTYANTNGSARTFASWTFRKQPKFFDVVTYTGNYTARTIAHSLGSVPGCIIVKKTSSADDWRVYHRSLATNQYMTLETTAAVGTSATMWNNTAPTSTVFSIGAEGSVNDPGETFVAYLFAHNAGGFGLTGTDNVISCGSYEGNDGPRSVNLGYEAQWVLIKNTNTGNWHIFDNMRGMPVTGGTPWLVPNLSNAESSSAGPVCRATATGFIADSDISVNGNTYIYIAIRRGPMKTPTSGTSVFKPVAQTGDSNISVGFPTDFGLRYNRAGGATIAVDRLRGSVGLYTPLTDAESAASTVKFDQQNLMTYGLGAGASVATYQWRRAPGFFDVVCYTGTGVARTINHNLGVAPELMIVKNRSSAVSWFVYSAALGNDQQIILNSNGTASGGTSAWNNTSPTASVFSVGATGTGTNASGSNYVAYLFASCPGVSKVGSYTGTGATLTISCGFAARFVLIKRTEIGPSNWVVWDTARGMVAGTDPRLELNTTNAETNANWVYTNASGFQIVTTDATVNASGGSYIYLAIA